MTKLEAIRHRVERGWRDAWKPGVDGTQQCRADRELLLRKVDDLQQQLEEAVKEQHRLRRSLGGP